MLVSSKEIIRIAQAKNEAVAAFNVTGLTSLKAIINAAEEVNRGVIIEFVQVHEIDGIIDLDTIGPLMVMMAEKAKVPVAVHLDHCIDLDYFHRALEMGFTSVMFDGSALPYEENVAQTTLAVNLAHEYGATVEAEIGKMAGFTLNNDGVVENRACDRSNFTNPLQAKDFVQRTGVDMLACSFGTSHGMYVAAPQLDAELVKEIFEATNVPIVMHGSSGVKDEDYAKVINNGVRKINYYTYMSKDAGDHIKEYVLQHQNDVILHHETEVISYKAIKAHCIHAMKLFMNKD